MPKRKQSNLSKWDDSSSSKEKKKPSEDEWSKSKKKRMRRLKSKQNKKDFPEKTTNLDTSAVGMLSNKPKGVKIDSSAMDTPSNEPKGVKTSSALQQSFMARLTGSRFRELNEELYTTTSSSAFKRFSSNPELYEQYHDGFRHQVEQWPDNPVDVIAKWLVTNFRKQSSCVVADFGCGDAALAQKLVRYKHKGTCPFRVNSFDLVASSDLVTACDMAHVPLPPKTVDVAVFCLSLMGTNLADFLREAHRVLKDTGVLKIAEVRSRFESTDKKDELKDFVHALDKVGFKCLKTDRSNKMFVVLECKKNGKKPQADLRVTAKPCIYKRR